MPVLCQLCWPGWIIKLLLPSQYQHPNGVCFQKQSPALALLYKSYFAFDLSSSRSGFSKCYVRNTNTVFGLDGLDPKKTGKKMYLFKAQALRTTSYLAFYESQLAEVICLYVPFLLEVVFLCILTCTSFPSQFQWAYELGHSGEEPVNIPLHACEHFYLLTHPLKEPLASNVPSKGSSVYQRITSAFPRWCNYDKRANYGLSALSWKYFLTILL